MCAPACTLVELHSSATRAHQEKAFAMNDETTIMTHDKIQAEIAKLIAETAKINRENIFYPVIVTATATLAIVAVVKIFL